MTLTLANNGRTALEDVRLDLQAPAGWQVRATSDTSFDNLPPAGARRSVTTTWMVTPTSDAQPGFYQLTGDATYTYGDQQRPGAVESQREVHVSTAG